VIAGQIGLVRNAAGFLGKAVEWATDSTSHHVVVAVSETECVSADIGGVILRHPAEFHSLEWSRFDLTDDQSDRIVNAAFGMLGRPYNVAAIILLLLSHLARVPIPRFAVKWLERRPELDCSQLSDLALTAGGIDLFTYESALVVPAHFETYFRAAGWLDPSTSKINS